MARPSLRSRPHSGSRAAVGRIMLKKLRCKLRGVLSAVGEMIGDLRSMPREAWANSRRNVSWNPPKCTPRCMPKVVWFYIYRFANLWVALPGLASFSVLLWHFDLVGSVATNVLLSTGYLVICIACLASGFLKDGERPGVVFNVAMPSMVSITGVVAAFAQEASLPAVGINAIFVLISAFILRWYWGVIEGKRGWLLLVVTIPAVAAAWLYYLSYATSANQAFEYLFMPLPVLSLGAVCWVFIGRELLAGADRHQERLVRGPALESLAMLWLFIPFIVFTVLAVNALGFGGTWVTISGILVGLLFSGTISEPVRKLVAGLRDLSLPDDRRAETGDDSQGEQCDTESIS